MPAQAAIIFSDGFETGGTALVGRHPDTVVEGTAVWVAFTYEPITLAQKTLNLKRDEPFMKFKEAEKPESVNMLVKSSGSKVAFSIRKARLRNGVEGSGNGEDAAMPGEVFHGWSGDWQQGVCERGV